MKDTCYNLKKLEKFQSNVFICERKSTKTELLYTYTTIIQEASRCIEYLQKYNVKNNVGIGIDMKEHSAATCVLLLGILNHECHFYCLDMDSTKSVAEYLKSSGVGYVISPKNCNHNNILKNTENKIKVFEEVFYLYYLENYNIDLENPSKCYTIATSGSTGLPKIVHVPYHCIETNIKTLSQLFNIEETDTIFLGSPPTFDPFVVEFFMSLENGASILITSKEIRLQPQLLLEVMFPKKTLSKAVTLYQTTPSLFRLFGEESIKSSMLNKNSSLRCLVLGGEEFPSSLELESWLPLDFFSTGKRIFNIYGITEVSCWSSIYELDDKTKTLPRANAPLGNPLDNFTFFRLVDEEGNVLHHNGCKAELEIGSSIRRCYIPQYDNDGKNFKENDIIYRKTGDLVERDRNGNIYYIGRTNNTIKRLGKRLCLDSLSKKVENILKVNNMNFRAISLWHKDSSNLIYYLVNNKNERRDDKGTIINVLKETLERHEQPDKIFFSQKLLINSHGKVDSKSILEEILLPAKSPVKIFQYFLTNVMGFQMDIDSHELQPSTSKRLKLSENISFTKAGGTSFQAISLANEIGQHIKGNIEQRKVLEMLLDNDVTIQDVLTFLISCSKKDTFEEVLNARRLKDIETRFNFKLLWRCDLKKCIDAAPSVYEDKFVIVGSHSHLVLTVNATTGDEVSRLKLNDRIECPVVFATSHLALVGCYDGFLYGFDFNSGTILWKFNARGMIKAKPLIIRNMVIIGSYAEDYNVVAFDIKSLAVIWSLKLGSRGIFSSPVQITEQSVLFCSLDGTYALVEVDTGSIKWLRKFDTPIFSTALKIQTSYEMFLAIAEVSGQISICNAECGERITSYQAEGNVFSSLALHQPEHKDHSLIIFGCHDKNIYCLKIKHLMKQLTLIHQFSLNSAVYSTPILISKRYILVCSTRGLITLLDLQQFSVLATTDLKSEIFSSPSCLCDKYIYIGSRDNNLYCFQIEN